MQHGTRAVRLIQDSEPANLTDVGGVPLERDAVEDLTVSDGYMAEQQRCCEDGTRCAGTLVFVRIYIKHSGALCILSSTFIARHRHSELGMGALLAQIPALTELRYPFLLSEQCTPVAAVKIA